MAPSKSAQPDSNTKLTNSSAENLQCVYEDPDTLRAADSQRPQPVRPPPRPPASMKSKSGIRAQSSDRGTRPDPPVQTCRPERTPPPLPPLPPLPPPRADQAPVSPLYYDRPSYELSLRSERSSLRLSPVSMLREESTQESQVRPPPPDLTPPPPPSVSSENLYTPYLDILPDDMGYMEYTPSLSLRSGLSESVYLSGFDSLYQQSTEQDINGLLTWMSRKSRYDFTAPSLYGLSIQEEVRSFNTLALNVAKALRLFSLLMMKRKDNLQRIISEFRSISQHLDKVKRKTKAMGIAGGTTGAVGGVTAVVGIALAPMTMGISLVATAVGATMVASAGGMGAHAAKANKKVVNRTTVEKLVHDYKKDVVDLEHCLDLILAGMNELLRHDTGRLQRAHPEALMVAHKSRAVFRNNSRSTAHASGQPSDRLLQAFTKEMDQFFTEKKGQKLKKSNKTRFSGRVEQLAKNLQEELDHLDQQWQAFS